MKAYMFPGQGSQSTGMGQSLFDDYSELVEKVDSILGYSLKELCLDNPDRKLNKTQYTQPAIFVVNALSYYRKVEEDGEPDYLLGHSLGEFNALHAAGFFTLEAGVKLVKKRGELMADAKNGSMAAILNSSKEEIEQILQDNNLDNIDLANYNTGSQIVISGLTEEIEKAEPFFRTGKVLYYPLNTGGAFHSRFMKSAGDSYENYLKRFKFSAPSIPVISNVTAKEYQADSVVENLSAQISNTVRWLESIEYLKSLESDDEIVVEEVGHGDVLTKIYMTIESERKANTSSADKPRVAASENKRDEDEVKTESSESELNASVSTDDSSPQPNGQSDVVELATVTITAQEKVADWNRQYGVGTTVRSSNNDYGDLVTRTDGVVLFGHRAAVYMEGYKGYFDLDELHPLKKSAS